MAEGVFGRVHGGAKKCLYWDDTIVVGGWNTVLGGRSGKGTGESVGEENREEEIGRLHEGPGSDPDDELDDHVKCRSEDHDKVIVLMFVRGENSLSYVRPLQGACSCMFGMQKPHVSSALRL